MKQQVLLTAALASTTLGVASVSHAQEIFPNTPAPGTSRNHSLRVRNVSPSIMAWWLDPANNGEPIEFQAARQSGSNVFPVQAGAYDPAKPIADFKLPAGVQRIVAIDPQGALMVFGTDEGVRKLLDTIHDLDKPQSQIEVEVQYVSVNPKDVKRLGIKSISIPGDSGPFKRGEVPADISSRLGQLMTEHKASLITAPRVTAFNGLAGSLHSGYTRPGAVTLKQDGSMTFKQDGSFESNGSTQPENADSPLALTVGYGIDVKPSVQDDDSINLMLHPIRTLQLIDRDSKKVLSKLVLDGLQNINGLHDGQTVALTAEKPSALEGIIKSEQNPSSLVLLVKVHLIKPILKQ